MEFADLEADATGFGRFPSPLGAEGGGVAAIDGETRRRSLGVARVGAAWFALLRPSDGGEPVSLAVGDAHEGWRVAAIGAEGVTFADAPGAATRRITLAPRVARP